jgi:hypothetical protein
VAALKETGSFNAAGYKEAQDRYILYYESMAEMEKSTKDMSMESDSAAAAMMRFSKSFADLQVTIGTNLLPTFTALINSLTWFIDLLGPSLSSVLALSAGIVGIATALAYVLGPLRAVTILLSSNPLGIVVVALGIILPLLYDYANRMGYIQKAMDWLSSLDIEKKLSGLGEFALKVILPKAEFLSPMILLLKFLYNESGTISAIVVKIYDLLRNFVGWVLTGIAGIIKWIQDIPTRLTELKDAIVTSILSIPEKIVSTLKNLKDAIYKFLGIETPEETKQKQDELYEASLAKGFSEREAHQIAYPKDKYFYMPGEAAHPLSELGITEEEAKKQGMLQEIKTFDEQQEKEIARLKGEHYKPERSAVESLASAPGEALITTGAQVEKYGQASVTKFLTPVNQKFHEKVEEKSKLPGIIGSIIRSDWEVATNPAAAATGGYIKSDGLIKLHAGERVLSESDVQRGGSAGGDITVNLTINNPLFTNSSEMYKFDQHIRDIINRENLCHMTNKRGRGMIV